MPALSRRGKICSSPPPEYFSETCLTGILLWVIFAGMNKLQTYLKDNTLSQSRFAEMIGVNQATISKLCAGAISPNLETAQKIATATNGAVPLDSWPKLAALLKAARSAA